MSSRPKTKSPNLFAAAGLERDAPRPLADKLRPDRLADVVGQDDLVGPDGVLTRMLATRTLGSLIFWGPPGTGKTTLASVLATTSHKHFVPLSAVSAGVKDVRDAAERGRQRLGDQCRGDTRVLGLDQRDDARHQCARRARPVDGVVQAVPPLGGDALAGRGDLDGKVAA